MPDESGWRGGDALNNDDLAHQFWNMVTRPAEVSDINVGDIVTVEITHDGEVLKRRTARVVECMRSSNGEPQVRLEDIAEDEAVTHSGTVVVLPV